MKSILYGIILALLCISPVFAQYNAISEEPSERLLTVYNKNMSAIYDIRMVELQQGENEIQILNIPELYSIDRISVFFDKGELIDVRYPVSRPGLSSVMERLSGSQVKLIRNDETHEGVLDHYQGTITLTGPDGMMLFDRPQEFILSPQESQLSLIGETALTLRIHAEEAGLQPVGLLYGNRQIGWSALHSIRLYPETKTFDWLTEAHILSRSESDMDDVRVRLLAGDVTIRRLPGIGTGRVNRVFDTDEYIDMDAFLDMESDKEVVASGFAIRAGGSIPVQESLADFFVYNLPGTFELRSQELSTITLHENEGLSYETEHYYYITGSDTSNMRPAAFALLNKNDDSLLPQTLPEGPGYVSTISANGQPSFEANMSFNMVSPGDAIYLPLRETAPVHITESYRTEGQRNEDRQHYHTIQLENTGDENVSLFLRRNVSNTARVVRSSITFERQAGYLQAELNLRPGETREVTLHVVYPRN